MKAEIVASVVIVVCLLMVTHEALTQSRQVLRSPSTFADISDRTQRSQALFSEAAKVLTHPRCMNCHPAGDRPSQGMDMHAHYPPAWRGAIGVGVPGNTCSQCHHQRNFDLSEKATYSSIPGHPKWQLAPVEMSWQGKSLGELCAQIKDRNRNGGRDLAMLQQHMATDELVAWGWAPGTGREPAPGTQEQFGALIQAWIDTGAACP